MMLKFKGERERDREHEATSLQVHKILTLLWKAHEQWKMKEEGKIFFSFKIRIFKF